MYIYPFPLSLTWHDEIFNSIIFFYSRYPCSYANHIGCRQLETDLQLHLCRTPAKTPHNLKTKLVPVVPSYPLPPLPVQCPRLWCCLSRSFNLERYYQTEWFWRMVELACQRLRKYLCSTGLVPDWDHRWPRKWLLLPGDLPSPILQHRQYFLLSLALHHHLPALLTPVVVSSGLTQPPPGQTCPF